MIKLPNWADWLPHFAPLSYWDGEKIICRCYFIIFRWAFSFGRPMHILKEHMNALTVGKEITITVNGKKHTFNRLEEISYVQLCMIAFKDPEYTPTIVYSFPDGRNGSISKGNAVQLEDGMIINVAITGSA